MLNIFRSLDRLLRGESTTLESLRDGVRVSATALLGVVFLLGTTYGACMGMFAVTGSGSNSWMQIVGSMIKLPLLFIFTLVVTFPSLYVFNALVGSRLSFVSLLRLLVGTLAITMAVLASLGPIVAFFSLSTTSYAFMVLLNVAVCGVAGLLGLSFLLQTLHRIGLAESAPAEGPPPLLPDPATLPGTDLVGGDWGSVVPPPLVPKPGPLDRVATDHAKAKNVRNVFRIWILVFGLVGAQMSWVMRPFIGSPNKPYTFFREREGNFFEGVISKVKVVFGTDQREGPSRRGGR